MTDPNQSATEPSEGKTPTPRTDVEVVKVMTQYTEYGDCVKADFARTLERENQSLRKAAEAARVALEVALETISILADDIPLLGPVVEQYIQGISEAITAALAELRARLEETK